MVNIHITKKHLLAIIFTLTCFIGNAQVLINEVCTSNSTTVLDEDSDSPDWIELYNSGASSVDLYKYAISDDGTQLRKWIFPSYILAPSAHLIVFASDKDRKTLVNHWETVIKDDDIWKYQVPTVEPPATWRNPSFNDASWSSGKGGFGYGDGDDSTIITSPTNSVYIRKTFNVTDKLKIAEAVLHIDYDDGYVAYLNGIAIGRKNMPNGFPPYNTDATAGREATMYLAGLPETKLVNHDTLMLALVNGTNVLCIQVHNNLISSSDITARAFLSFGITDPSILYSPTPSWFNITNSLPMHTNFKLTDGDPLYLVDSFSVIKDYKLLIPTKNDHSYGRQTDGSTNWVVFTSPTPNASNNSATSYPSYCNSTLTFSASAGFYSSTQSISITGNSEIRYTLDGSEPSISSTLFTAPLTINATTVVKAACFSGGTIPIQSYTNTYFINENTTLPVFSISANPSDFFDPITGIYMLGPNADSANYPYFGANFWEDWERQIHVEFFEKDKTKKIGQDADVRIFGNWSRGAAQKSLALKAKQKYGNPSFDYKFFPEKHISKFTQLVLRNSGGDNNYTHYRDGFIQKSVSKMTSLDIQDYRPAIVFINGQYWGILNMREKINSTYIETNHNVPKEKVDLADTWGNALEGTNNIYQLQMIAKNLDMTVQANYNLLADSFDLDNMVDYFSTEIFISNWDWPQNNVKFWRPSEGNRKWRYILWDTDISYGLFGFQDYNFNQLGRVLNAGPLDIGPHADIFNELVKNTSFRNKFVNRYADMMNTLFKTTTLRKLQQDMRDSIAPEIPRHWARWSAWTDWASEIQVIDDFYTNRLTPARNEIESEFNLTKQVNVTLAVSPAGAGIIKINSIYPDTYPWTGVYFDGVPVEITAIPNPGYTFNYWQSSSLITTANSNQIISINVTSSNETFTAFFTGTSAPLAIAVTEINYQSLPSADAGDWLEIHNYGTAPVNLSGWVLKDYFHQYTFPLNTTIDAGRYLVLSSDILKFQTQYPNTTNFIGPIGMSLSNDGDGISLYRPNGALYNNFVFNDAFPWPTAPNGLGYTLESIDNTSDRNLYSTWFAGCLGGSPGYGYSPSCELATLESEKATIVTLYPNPTKNIITITIPNSQTLTDWKLVNNQGIEILKDEIQDEYYSEKIDLSNYPSGLYTAVFYGENKKIIKKIILQ